MADSLMIGISGLLAAQRSLATASHNVSNANTEGYSRQRVELETRPPQAASNGFIGKGVDISTVRRLADSFLNKQLETNISGEARHAGYAQFARLVDDLLADPQTGVGPALSNFFNALQDVNNDPSSIATRQAMLGMAEELVVRVNEQGRQLAFIDRGINAEIEDGVRQVNAIAREIADLNREIVLQSSVAQGQPPNDLLDERDRLLRDLAGFADIQTVAQQDGAVNVIFGNGLSLVGGAISYPLQAIANPTDSSRMEVAYGTGASQAIVSGSISTGRLGGLLAVREEVLDVSRNQLGRLAVTLSATFNAQHREGLDLDGQLGGDFFAVGDVKVLSSPGNTGAVGVTRDPAQVSQLTASDYRLRYDGADFILTELNTGAQTTLSGPGPFSVDGMVITVTGAPAAGDEYRLQPTRVGATSFALLADDPAAIAVAGPIRSSAALANIGDAQVSSPTVLDSTNPALQTGVSLVFADAGNYQVNGAGPLIPYTPGANIDLNGWRVQITGSPVAGDTFVVQSNANGRGDNSNGRLLAALQQTDIIDGGTQSYEEAYGELVGQVGTNTQRANISLASLTTLRENSEAARERVSGVNLDEEAANILKFQQAYQAAAQVISVSNELFDSLLNAVRS